MPSYYKKIRVHFVFAIKYDGRHNACLVADGHLTDIPVDSVYSGVISLRGLRVVIFLAEMNGLELWSTEDGNAYLEAKTQDKVYFIAGPEFGPSRQGHTLVIYKSLYGLRSRGLRLRERFPACLRSLGFAPYKEEPDIWIRAYKDER
jgi:Reverse transcriptase (RNA-dependent DNA polymerase)